MRLTRRTTQKELAVRRAHYRRNRPRIRAQAKLRYKQQLQRVSVEELEAYRNDPRKAISAEGVVCLVCGQRCPRQLGGHLRQVHQMTTATYKEEWGYNIGTGLVSPDLHKQLARAKKRPSARRHLAAIRAPAEKMIAARRPRKEVVRLEYRLNRKDLKGRARPDLWKRARNGKVATDVEIAKRRLRGETHKAIAAAVGLGPRSKSSVGTRLRKMGFPRSPCVFSRGEPVTGRWILDFCRDFNKTKRDVARLLRLGQERIYRQSIGSKLEQPLSIETANLLLSVRATLSAQYRKKAAGPTGGRPRLLLPSERKAIPVKYQSLRRDLKLLRDWFQENGNSANLKQVWDRICTQSRMGRFRTLLYWPEFIRWMEKAEHTPSSLRGSFSPSDLAFEFLAKDYDASVKTIKRAVLRT